MRFCDIFDSSVYKSEERGYIIENCKKNGNRKCRNVENFENIQSFGCQCIYRAFLLFKTIAENIKIDKKAHLSAERR